MNAAVDQAPWTSELTGWVLRGLLCAAPSAFCAVLFGFQHPTEISAMVLVTVLYIAGFAWFSAWDVMAATPGRRRFLRALKMSAWIKPASVVGLGAVAALLSGFGLNAEPWFAGIGPDAALGAVALSAVGWLSGVRDLGVGSLDSFAWTALTTLLQGALLTGLLLLMAAAVLAWWRLWDWLRCKLRFSPARSPG